jgi:hypothetical protein
MNYSAKNTIFMNHAVHPKLLQFMEGIFVKAPNLEFVPTETDYDHEEFVNKVQAYAADQMVGTVRIIKKEYPSKGAVKLFQIQSPFIHKEKGTKDQKTTISLKKAIQIGLEVFRTSANILVKKYVYEAQQKTTTLSMSAKRAAYGVTESNTAMRMAEYMTEVFNAPEARIPIPSFFDDKLPKWTVLLNNMRVARTMETKVDNSKGVIVYAEKSGALSFIDLSNMELKKFENSYALPKNYQDKFLLLQMVEDDQAVDNVGVKWKREVPLEHLRGYYLVDGEVVAY